ncbi:hypothetical protein C8R46DRAFT_1038461 [Mycena filopes]|nr:hypothetical protein C8R46DRAFT_1038461 [Mycena filopes]
MEYVVDTRLFDYNWTELDCVGIHHCQSRCIYLMLFTLAIHTLARRKKPGKRLLLAYTWTMAGFGTIQLVLYLVTTTISARFVEILVKQHVTRSNLNSELSKLVLASQSLFLAQSFVFAVNNFVTDTLLVECPSSWGYIVYTSSVVPLLRDMGIAMATNLLACHSDGMHCRYSQNIVPTLIIVRVGLGQNTREKASTRPVEPSILPSSGSAPVYRFPRVTASLDDILDIKPSEGTRTGGDSL